MFHREQEQQYGPRHEETYWGSRAEKGLPTHDREKGYGGWEQQGGRGFERGFGEQRGYEKLGGGIGSGVKELGTAGVGNMVTKNIERECFSLGELMHVNMGLIITGQCYIKEHILLLLLGGGHATGSEAVGYNEVRSWHQNVTIKNLRALYHLADKMQLPLPFLEPLEQREQIIKKSLGQVGPVITSHEALTEIKLGAIHLAHCWVQATMTSFNENVRQIFQECASNVFTEFPHLKEALKKLEYCPVPFVKSFVACDTGVVSHTEKRDVGGQGMGQQDFGSQRSVDRGIGDRGIIGSTTTGLQERSGVGSGVGGVGMGSSRSIPIR
jgi:hypothetical protein